MLKKCTKCQENKPVAASNSVSVPKTFVADFECVAKFYKLEEMGELADARAAVKRDTANAIVTYARLADAVKKGNA